MTVDAKNEGPAIAQANGLSLCYQQFGPADGRPLVLVMGFGAQMIHWDARFCELLGSRGFRVVRFDNRDVGQSSWLDSMPAPSAMSIMSARLAGQTVRVPYSLGDMAADTLGLMDFLGMKAAHVVGASMGGMIAQEMAIAHPDRVLSLTSVMSSTGDPSLPKPKPEVMAVMMRPAQTGRDAYIEATKVLLGALRSPQEVADAQADAEFAALAFDRGVNPEGRARQFAALMVSGNRKSALSALRVPTLVIHGVDDPLIPLPAGEDTAATIPGARLVAIEGMGHSLPEAAWPRIVDAIDRHSRRER